MNNLSPIISERFWSKVEVGQVLKCWKWKGATDKLGYGQFRMEGKTIKAPRVAFWLRNGEWPVNALHKCDNPTCCNPDHIFSGTHLDNMKDMSQKGRCNPNYGEKHGRAKLTNSKVISIREDYRSGIYSMSLLAEKYECGFSTIQRVVTRKNWKHLP